MRRMQPVAMAMARSTARRYVHRLHLLLLSTLVAQLAVMLIGRCTVVVFVVLSGPRVVSMPTVQLGALQLISTHHFGGRLFSSTPAKGYESFA